MFSYAPSVATWRRGAVLLLVNGALSLLVLMAAPPEPRLSDRAEYEYSGRNGLTPNCPYSIYCYRILVPMLLERMPGNPDQRWRVLQWLAHTATGTIMSMAIAPVGSPWLAAVMLQSSYGFAFTAYDPYTADPVVFLIAALVFYLWMVDRPLAAASITAIGVFAKETVALVAMAPAIAVMLSDRQTRWRWVAGAVIACAVLLSFHWYMDTYEGWGISRNPAANFSAGSWLALWWRNNPSIIRKALMLFSPFGWAWMFALLGYRDATPAIRRLALGAVLPIGVLVYVQTPERALANAFFAVVPLATVFLSRVSPAAAWAAVVTNGLVTARIGLSTEWLPSISMLLIPASLCATWAVASSRRGLRLSS